MTTHLSTNDLRFDQWVAVITGTRGGLGRQYALLLASRGARVVVNDTGKPVTGDGSDIEAAQAVTTHEQLRRDQNRADRIHACAGCRGSRP